MPRPRPDEGRLYTFVNAPRCSVCKGPMVPDATASVHLTCSRAFLQLLRDRARRGIRR